MLNLTNTQLILLATAAQRGDGSVLPLPKKTKLKPDLMESTFKSLLKKKLIAEQPTAQQAAAWRSGEDGEHMTLVITQAGLQAIGAEPANPAAAGKAVQTAKPEAGKPQSAKSRRSGTSKPHPDQAGRSKPAAPRAARVGSKLAKVIGLLRRPTGTSIEEIMKATGWQAHSVRGVLSGALKKKLGLKIMSEMAKSGGRRYRIAG